MNRYETFSIFDMEATSDERKVILERIEALISGRNGTLLVFDKWGGRKLAYPIGKKNQGYYVRIDYCGNGELVDAIEQMLRHDHRVLRFMTVLQASDIDPDALKAEMAEAEKAPEPAAAPEKEVTAPKAETTPIESEIEEKE